MSAAEVARGDERHFSDLEWAFLAPDFHLELRAILAKLLIDITHRHGAFHRRAEHATCNLPNLVAVKVENLVVGPCRWTCTNKRHTRTAQRNRQSDATPASPQAKKINGRARRLSSPASPQGKKKSLVESAGFRLYAPLFTNPTRFFVTRERSAILAKIGSDPTNPPGVRRDLGIVQSKAADTGSVVSSMSLP